MQHHIFGLFSNNNGISGIPDAPTKRPICQGHLRLPRCNSSWEMRTGVRTHVGQPALIVRVVSIRVVCREDVGERHPAMALTHARPSAENMYTACVSTRRCTVGRQAGRSFARKQAINRATLARHVPALLQTTHAAFTQGSNSQTDARFPCTRAPAYRP
jgi:hypothetical protein